MYMYIYIYNTYIYIYIYIISITISTNSGINMAVIVHCLCDLHWLLHVCMRCACVYEQIYE